MTKGMTNEDFEQLDFELHLGFVKAHHLKEPKDLDAFINKFGLDYYQKWKFEALIEREGITSQRQWAKFLRDNPVIPTY
jgi:hypothetical protein